MATPILFISHSAPDKPLADALREAILGLLSESKTAIEIRYSSSAESGPQGGAAWRQWIEEQVVLALSALVLVTRGSVTKPWLLWEAGACRGVALARGTAGSADDDPEPQVTTLRYGVNPEECPDPLRAEQIISGTDCEQMKELLLQILTHYGVGSLEMGRLGGRLSSVVAQYLKRVEAAMLKSPAIVNEANVQEWLVRLDELAGEGRWSELAGYQRWLNLSFGRDAQSMHIPIDVRLHRRLGEHHLGQRRYTNAIEQLSLARRSAPRDMYILRRLGEACIKRVMNGGEPDDEQIKQIFERIADLDPGFLAANPETAALYGKYVRRILKDTTRAADLYRVALQQSPESYYLADVLGQTLLEGGDRPGAESAFKTALEIIEGLGERNLWTLATEAAANLVLGRTEQATATLERILELEPGPDDRESIAKGLREIQGLLFVGPEGFEALVEKLSCSSGPRKPGSP